MSTAMGGKARILLKSIKQTGECIVVRDWVLKALNEGRISWYTQSDGAMGDTHHLGPIGQHQNLYDRIHLFSQNFGNDHEELMILLHEGYHSYYEAYAITDDYSAEGFAGNCALI